jgi:hypothetical protein
MSSGKGAMTMTARKRKFRAGTMIRMTILQAAMKDGSTAYYWIEVPEGMTNEQAAETQKWHGPFKTDAEADEDFCAVVLGAQSKEVIDGGMWDPAWERLQ